MRSRKSLQIGQKTSSLGQILEKPCVSSRGHIFHSDSHETWSECLFRWNFGQLWNGPCWVKNKVTRSNLRKTLCMLYRPQFQLDTHERLSEWLPRWNLVQFWKWVMSGQILEKPCVLLRFHIFGPILMKLGQNVCLDVILDESKNESCRVKPRSNLIKTFCPL